MKKSGALIRFAGLAVVAAILAACSGGNTVSFGDRDKVTIGDYQVKWADASALTGGKRDGLTPMMFIFSNLRTPSTTLTLEQRQTMAKSALEASSRCKWALFDPQFNAQSAFGAGAVDFTLYAFARCP